MPILRSQSSISPPAAGPAAADVRFGRRGLRSISVTVATLTLAGGLCAGPVAEGADSAVTPLNSNIVVTGAGTYAILILLTCIPSDVVVMCDPPFRSPIFPAAAYVPSETVASIAPLFLAIKPDP